MVLKSDLGARGLSGGGIAWVVKRQQQHSDSGLTLMECLVALTTVALAGTLAGPPLLIASATQIQNRRVQQAQHIAQGEIDRVRAVARQLGTGITSADLPPASIADQAEQPPPRAIAAVRSPFEHCHNGNAVTQADQGIGVDLDGDADCTPEFVLQSFRTGQSPSAAAAESAMPFDVVVRVYAASKGNAPTEGLQPGLAPIRLSQTTSSRRPLAVATTAIVPERPATLLCYHSSQCLP